MRLIDVEQTLWEMRFEESKYEYEENYGYRQAEEFIKQQPTVEAIPIVWMEEWLSKFFKEINGRTYYMGDGYDSVQDMLDDWRKEND